MSTYNNNFIKKVAGSLLLLLGMCIVFTAPVAEIKQEIKKGTTGVIHTGGGDINIGYTIEQHEKALKEREKSIRKELEKLYQSKNKNLSFEKQLLERNLTDVENLLQSLTNSYQKRIKLLESTITKLLTIAGEENNDQVADAVSALQQGDTERADQLFKQIEESEKSSVERAAKAAFERGIFARANFDYRNAYRHFERAVGLSPNNPQYLEFAGLMAQAVANHQKEIEWKEKALTIYLNQNRTDSADVARLRNSLGTAWNALGEYKKAIEYYELALVTFEKVLGIDHSAMASYRNKLGLAWNSLGEYKKAIEYYEQALTICLNQNRIDSAYVARLRNNLGSAWNALGEYKKAIEYYELALVTFEKVLGIDDPNTKTVANNLAGAKAARQEPY